MATIKCSGSETCKKEEYIVEVIGNRHCATQRVELNIGHDNSNQIASERLINKYGNTLNIWTVPINEGGPKDATMVIKTEQGEARLLIYDWIYTSKRNKKYQDYVIAPFVPLVPVHENKSGSIHARDGFLYIFMEQKIWREIRIKFNDDGLPVYQDTLLTKLRADDPEAKIPSEYERPVIGLDMEAIWLPTRHNRDRYIASNFEGKEKIQLFYSEVQLSAQRLTIMERYPQLLKNRMVQKLNLTLELKYKNTFPAPGQIICLSGVYPQRPRSKQGLLEMAFADPVAYLHDIKGNYCQNMLAFATKELDRLETRRSSGHNFFYGLTNVRRGYNAGTNNPALPRDDMLFRHKALTLSTHRPKPAAADNHDTDKNDDALWQSHGAVTDIFSIARKKGYLGLVLSDELFDLKHKVEQITQGLNYLNDVLQYIARHPHFNFTNAVYHLFAPWSSNPDETPLRRRYGDKVLYEHSNAPIKCILLPELRRLAKDTIDWLQSQAYRFVNSSACLAALTDLFSLNNEDYAAGHILISRLAHSLLYSSDGMDHFSQMENLRTHKSNLKCQKYTKYGLNFIRYTHRGTALGRMLFPSEKAIPVDAPWDYRQCLQQGPQPNYGDGRCRIYELLVLAKGGKLSNHPPQSSDVNLATMIDQAMAQSDSPLSGSLAGTKRFFNDFANSVSGLIVMGQAYLSQMAGDTSITELKGSVFANTFRLHKLFEVEYLSPLFIASADEIPEGHVPIGGKVSGKTSGTFGIIATQPSKVVNGVKNIEIGTAQDDLQLANQRQRFIEPKGVAKKTLKRQYPHVEISLFVAPEHSEVARVSQSAKIQTWEAGKKLDQRLLKISPLLLFLEVWNLQQAIQLANTRGEEDRSSRHIFSIISAGIDVALTIERTLALIDQHNIITKKLTRNSISTGKEWWLARATPGSFWHNMASRLIPRIATSFAFGGISGVIGTGIYIADAHNDWSQGDYDAAVANSVAAMAAAGSAGSMVAGALQFAWAGPAFWIFLGIGAIAGAIAIWLDDDDIELLLSHGPLAYRPNRKRYGYLQQPDEAFYRLISYLSKPDFSITPLTKPSQSLVAFPPHYNQKIMITLPFPEWFELHRCRIDCRIRYKKQTFSESQGMFYTTKEGEVSDDAPLYSITPQGIEVLVHLPVTEISGGKLFSPVKRTNYQLQLKLQLVTKPKGLTKENGSQEQLWVFPAPSVGDNLGFSQQDTIPDFEQKEQTFWYDFQWSHTHKKPNR